MNVWLNGNQKTRALFITPALLTWGILNTTLQSQQK